MSCSIRIPPSAQFSPCTSVESLASTIWSRLPGGNDIRCSPYACFGTQALSNYAVKALEGRSACLLGHHGLIVTAQTFEKALWLAVEVETLAKMYVHALAIGEPPRLSEAEMAQVHEQMKRMSYGQAPDLDNVGDVPLAVARSKRETQT